MPKKLSKRERTKRRRRSAHNTHLKKTYGITMEEYDKLLADQGGVCAICGGGTSYRHFSVDHNHRTGQIRGLLCRRCNGGLAKFMDNINNLVAAVAYMRSSGRRVNKVLERKAIVPDEK